MFFFLDLGLSSLPVYPEVLQRLKNGETIADVGCCFGQDLRELVFDGVPAKNTYGLDLNKEFIDLGYALFKDQDKLATKFLSADVFDEDDVEFNALDGKINIIYAGSFYHLWSWKDQVTAACRLVDLMVDEKGSMVVGRQAGNLHAGEVRHRIDSQGMMYQHNPASWEQLWVEIGKLTGTSWRVEASFSDADAGGQARGFDDPDTRILEFAVYRT